MNEIISNEQLNSEVNQAIKGVTLKLKHYEIDTIIRAIRLAGYPLKNGDYHRELSRRAMVYQVRKFAKRLLDISLTPREVYTLTLNPTEIEITQQSLYFIAGDNLTARLIYGNIHQKTI